MKLMSLFSTSSVVGFSQFVHATRVTASSPDPVIFGSRGVLPSASA
jgi:hypothetical protein